MNQNKAIEIQTWLRMFAVSVESKNGDHGPINADAIRHNLAEGFLEAYPYLRDDVCNDEGFEGWYRTFEMLFQQKEKPSPDQEESFYDFLHDYARTH